MKLMFEFSFDLLVTLDKGLEYQQNFTKYPIPILVLKVQRSDYEFLLPLIEKIRTHFATKLPEGVTTISPD